MKIFILHSYFYLFMSLLCPLFGSNTLQKAPINPPTNFNSFINIVDFLPENFVKDGTIDYTSTIQSLIDNNTNLLFPPFPLLVNEKGLNLRSNSVLYFPKGGCIKMKPNNSSHYSILHIENIQNIRIYNAVLIGDRKNHLGSSGEWGMGIYIKGAENIYITNAVISDCWGDGIDIMHSSDKNNSKNIFIEKCKIMRNRRNGITIGSGEDITIANCIISDTNGTLPMAGIDIEPNNNKAELGKIKIENLKTSSCRIGIQLGLSRYPSHKKRKINITIDNFESFTDEHGLLIGDYYRAHQYEPGIKKLTGTVSFSNIIINDSKNDPIKYYSQYGYEYGPNTIFKNIKIKNKGKLMESKGIKNNLKIRKFNIDQF
ncbi:right-handed parallel beta-helix repeat-containing protein [Proteiniphilum sp.]|uniref:right-handed parallel beta-helix repeat-containing protein n=1 Tax=Proteiniphilum sp. TaxID=1926877 RepID=UPI00331E06C1